MQGERPQPLPRAFFGRGAARVARELLGSVLYRRLGRHMLAGRIVETEAYVGEDDRACHAWRGPTRRNAVMYGPPGHAYVYFIYGMYDMLNVVCQPPGQPEAVLLRAVEPLHGIAAMQRHRAVERLTALANGPGKLCQAFGITRRHDGVDLRGPELWIGPGALRAGERIRRSPRIGVDYAGAAAARLLRFYVDGNAHVSRPPPARGRPRQVQNKKTRAAAARRIASP